MAPLIDADCQFVNAKLREKNVEPEFRDRVIRIERGGEVDEFRVDGSGDVDGRSSHPSFRAEHPRLSTPDKRTPGEGGVRPSTGQRQRLALARVFRKTRPF